MHNVTECVLRGYNLQGPYNFLYFDILKKFIFILYLFLYHETIKMKKS